MTKGVIDRYKERNFALVVGKDTGRKFLSQAALIQMHCLQTGLTSGFLYGDTLQEIYIILPEELRIKQEIEEDRVHRLLKLLNGAPDTPCIV